LFHISRSDALMISALIFQLTRSIPKLCQWERAGGAGFPACPFMKAPRLRPLKGGPVPGRDSGRVAQEERYVSSFFRLDRAYLVLLSLRTRIGKLSVPPAWKQAIIINSATIVVLKAILEAPPPQLNLFSRWRKTRRAATFRCRPSRKRLAPSPYASKLSSQSRKYSQPLREVPYPGR